MNRSTASAHLHRLTSRIVAALLAYLFLPGMFLLTAGNALAQPAATCSNESWTTPVDGRHHMQLKTALRDGRQVLELKHNFPGFVQVRLELAVLNTDGSTEMLPVTVRGISQLFITSVGIVTGDSSARPVQIRSMRIDYSEYGLPYSLAYDGGERICHLSREGRLCDYLGYFQTAPVANAYIAVERLPAPAVAKK